MSLLFAFGQVRFDRQVTAGTVVLAIDVSHSMGSTDVLPDRLAAAQVAATAFLDRLPAGFRVGLATFSVSSVRCRSSPRPTERASRPRWDRSPSTRGRER